MNKAVHGVVPCPRWSERGLLDELRMECGGGCGREFVVHWPHDTKCHIVDLRCTCGVVTSFAKEVAK